MDLGVITVKEELHSPQTFKTVASPSAGLLLYPKLSWRDGSYSSVVVQSAHYTAPAD